MPTDVVRPGYAFRGWFKRFPGFHGKDTDPYTEIADGDVWKWRQGATFTAKWEAEECTLTWDANGGVVTSDGPVSYGVAYGQLVGGLKEVERIGYDFIGWFTDKTYGEQVTPYTKISPLNGNSQTYYAHWMIRTFKVEFDANGGVGGWTRELEYGRTIVEPIPTRIGHRFDGW